MTNGWGSYVNRGASGDSSFRAKSFASYLIRPEFGERKNERKKSDRGALEPWRSYASADVCLEYSNSGQILYSFNGRFQGISRDVYTYIGVNSNASYSCIQIVYGRADLLRLDSG